MSDKPMKWAVAAAANCNQAASNATDVGGLSLNDGDYAAIIQRANEPLLAVVRALSVYEKLVMKDAPCIDRQVALSEMVVLLPAALEAMEVLK